MRYYVLYILAAILFYVFVTVRENITFQSRFGHAQMSYSVKF